MLAKNCECCWMNKPLSDYFRIDGIAGRRRYCIACHEVGKVKHGYGSYGDRFTSPARRTSPLS